MQPRYFKRLLPLTAMALLITAFLAIELEEPPGPCERPPIQARERGGTLATTQAKYNNEYEETLERATDMLIEHHDKFNAMVTSKPYVWQFTADFLEDENGSILEMPDGEGGCKRVVGFIVRVTERFDQTTLPPEDRIPDTIEGIPVQIIVEPYPFWLPTPGN